MKRQMKLRNTILITMILITTTILLLLGYASNRQFRTLLTDRMVDDYQETVNTMQKNVETLSRSDFASMALKCLQFRRNNKLRHN